MGSTSRGAFVRRSRILHGNYKLRLAEEILTASACKFGMTMQTVLDIIENEAKEQAFHELILGRASRFFKLLCVS